MKFWGIIKTALIVVAMLMLWAVGRVWINEQRMIQHGQEVSYVWRESKETHVGSPEHVNEHKEGGDRSP